MYEIVNQIFVYTFKILNYDFNFLGVSFSLYDYLIFSILATIILTFLLRTLSD